MMIFFLVVFFLSIISTFVLIAIDKAEGTIITMIIALISLLAVLMMMM